MAIADDDPAVAETFGYAATPGRPGALADAARRPGQHRVPRHLHAPGRRPRGDGHDRRRATSSRTTTSCCATGCSTGSRAASSSATSATTSSCRSTISSSATTPGIRRRNTTSYDPADASRMTPRRRRPRARLEPGRGLRLDFAYNGGGSALETAPRPAGGQVRQPAVNSAFGFINHTLEHPNLDCSTSAVHHPPGHREPGAGRASRGIPVTNAGRAGHGRALRAGQHPPGQPGHDRPAVVRRRRARRPAARSRPAPTSTR